MNNNTDRHDDGPAARSYSKLQAKVDRLEHLVHLLGERVGLGESDTKRLNRAVGIKDDDVYLPRVRAEAETLDRLSGEADRLTFVLENTPDRDDDPRPYIAGCECLWYDHADTPDAAANLAEEHVSDVHGRLGDLYPSLAGPSMPEVAA